MKPTQQKAMEMALEALKQAKDAVSDWGSYASEYFQKKHDLQGDLDAIQAQITAIRAALADQSGSEDKQAMTIKLPPMNDLIHAVGMNPAMLGACYVMLPEALEKVVREAVRLSMAPLSDEQIHAIDPAPHEMFDAQRIAFARAIEAAHGIKGD
jgi:hypothetical protein